MQNLNAANLEHLDAGHFDVVIIDEFHHAAAPSYRALLEHLSPRELLGLTATPERADGLPIYDTAALSNVYTANDAWARLVYQQLNDHVDDISTMRCLGFCVSVAHAQFMARHFRAFGISAISVSGDSPASERRDALRGLAEGRIQVVFSVDLFNEGPGDLFAAFAAAVA